MELGEPIDVDLRLPFNSNIISCGATSTGWVGQLDGWLVGWLAEVKSVIKDFTLTYYRKTYNVLQLLENPDAIWSNVPEDYEIWYV